MLFGEYFKSMAKKGGNPQNFNNPERTFAPQPLTVRVETHLDEYVRSLPNRTEWLRQAIAAQAERDRQARDAG